MSSIPEYPFSGGNSCSLIKLRVFFALDHATYTIFFSDSISHSTLASLLGISDGHKINTLLHSRPFALCTVDRCIKSFVITSLSSVSISETKISFSLLIISCLFVIPSDTACIASILSYSSIINGSQTTSFNEH